MRASTATPLLGRLWPTFANSYVLKALTVIAGSLLLWASAKVSVPFWPVPMTMQVFAVLLLGLGLGAGVTAALRQNRASDHLVMAVAMTGISIPNFVMAPLLILVFAIFLGWLWLGELVPAQVALGSAITLTAVVLALRS